MRADVVKRHLRNCGTNQGHGGAWNKKEKTNKKILEFEKLTYKPKKNKDSIFTEAAKFLTKRETKIFYGNLFASFLKAKHQDKIDEMCLNKKQTLVLTYEELYEKLPGLAR